MDNGQLTMDNGEVAKLQSGKAAKWQKAMGEVAKLQRASGKVAKW